MVTHFYKKSQLYVKNYVHLIQRKTVCIDLEKLFTIY